MKVYALLSANEAVAAAAAAAEDVEEVAADEEAEEEAEAEVQGQGQAEAFVPGVIGTFRGETGGGMTTTGAGTRTHGKGCAVWRLVQQAPTTA